MTAGVGLRSAGARAAANPLRSSGEALARLASGAELAWAQLTGGAPAPVPSPSPGLAAAGDGEAVDTW